MKKLLICCFAILLASVPVCSVSAAAPNTTVIIADDNYSLTVETTQELGDKFIGSDDVFTISPDGNSITSTLTMNYQGEVVPARSVNVTKTVGGSVYKGTVYLISYWYIVDTDITTANYEGTLYLQSSTSTS